MQVTEEKRVSWLDRPLITTVTLNWEVVLFASIIVLSVLTRFYILGARVMSHDESLHTYYSWLLFKGRGFQHTPLMHGPLQFHLIALSYFLFGDSDFTARIPAVLAGIFSVAFLWNYRSYLGRAGTLVAAAMLTISPFMLYYSRYVRNEALVVLFGLVTLWAMLRYLETGENRYLYYLTAATVLHFTAKETAFIYTAQALLFLAFLFIQHVTQREWPLPAYRRYFLIALILALMLFAIGLGSGIISRGLETLSPTETAAPAIPGTELPETGPGVPSVLTISLSIFGGLAVLTALFFLIRGYSWSRIRSERSFDLLILLGTLVLPHLSPFPVKLIGWDPLDYSSTGMFRTAAFLVPIAAISIGVGMWWRPREWLINAALFYSVYVVLYTTIFTNGGGFFTGMVGSLGYWLEQQGVQRGSQPWYYYLLVQIPVYEFLPLLGSLLAGYLGLRGWIRRTANGTPGSISGRAIPWDEGQGREGTPAIALFSFWAITSALAYTIAGEKMPWLAVHIALPLILVAGWGIGRLIERVDWSLYREHRGWLVVALLVIFFTSLGALLGSLLGRQPPFRGRELEQLQATSTFLMALVTAIGSGWGLTRLLQPWRTNQLARIAVLTVFSLLAVLTLRVSFLASYENYDEATEYLVYAHGARGVKEVMDQVEDISRRTTDGLALQVAYDDDISWPFTWYLRNYTNQRYYAASPTRDLRELPVILVGDNNFGKIEPIVGQAYNRFEYIRMVWPDQDYFNLNWARIWDALRNPEMRSALFQIWLNRDYTLYAQMVNKDMSLSNWRPADLMRMYVRKDVAARLWNYGVGPTPEEVVADPYEGGQIEVQADRVIGQQGLEPGQFQAPRDLAVAPDGSLYVADSRNNRIQHLAPDGTVLNTWGSFADVAVGAAPGGTFNEPWGVAVSPDGFVFVADTWNHRIQKFTSSGEFVDMWGYFGQAEVPEAFWGPRDVSVDSSGRLFVTDTGNKRVVIFDQDGAYLNEFGEAGISAGEFSEPVGVEVDPQGRVYVADTWNQRMQVIIETDDGQFTPFVTWDVAGWYGESLDNKPYLAASDDRVFVADPEGARILEFTSNGDFVRYWGNFGSGLDGFGLVSGLALDSDGGVWVSDGGNNRLMHFTLPPET